MRREKDFHYTVEYLGFPRRVKYFANKFDKKQAVVAFMDNNLYKMVYVFEDKTIEEVLEKVVLKPQTVTLLFEFNKDGSYSMWESFKRYRKTPTNARRLFVNNAIDSSISNSLDGFDKNPTIVLSKLLRDEFKEILMNYYKMSTLPIIKELEVIDANKFLYLIRFGKNIKYSIIDMPALIELNTAYDLLNCTDALRISKIIKEVK